MQIAYQQNLPRIFLSITGITDFPASMRNYKVFERDNEDIARNILYVPFEKKEIRPEDVSKHNFERKNQVTLLKISDTKGTWHFLALKS